MNSENFYFKYICLDCNQVFGDESGTPLSGSVIPLQIWIQCWYLSQYCDSIQHIADKLNLDINIIINMVNRIHSLYKERFLKSTSEFRAGYKACLVLFEIAIRKQPPSLNQSATIREQERLIRQLQRKIARQKNEINKLYERVGNQELITSLPKEVFKP